MSDSSKQVEVKAMSIKSSDTVVFDILNATLKHTHIVAEELVVHAMFPVSIIKHFEAVLTCCTP